MHKPPSDAEKKPKARKALLVGVGLDAKDDHVRVTRGRNFRLVGGSEETHDRMVGTAVKLNEKLRLLRNEERGLPFDADSSPKKKKRKNLAGLLRQQIPNRNSRIFRQGLG